MSVQDDTGIELAVRGERYFVRDDGGTGTPVLLLHGWPDDGSLFRHVRSRLKADGHRTIAIDWLAHGRSSRPASARRCSTPELIADVVALLDSLAVDRVHLVAHDYGATVAWEAAALHPARFHSFTAISVGPAIEILHDVAFGGFLRYHWLLLHALSVSVPYYLARNARRYRAKFASHPDADRILARLRSNDLMFFTVWERANPAPAVVFRNLFGPDSGRKVSVPTLGIYGRRDTWMTEGQLARAGRHVSAMWKYVAIDADHWIPLERPDTVSDLLLEWFDACTGK